MKLRILAISHEDCFGAPSLLLNLARALSRQECEFEFLVLKKRGLLFRDFKTIGKTFFFSEPPSRGSFYRIRSKLFSFKKRLMLKKIIWKWKPSVILVNTIVQSHFLEALGKCQVPVVIYVHELHTLFKWFALPFKKQFLSVPRHYIASSSAVYKYLLENYNLDPRTVSMAYDAIDLERIDRLFKEPLDKKLEDLTKGFDYIVGACGTVEWRKGTDLWLHIAAEVKQRMLPQKVGFIWIGTKPSLEDDGDSYKVALEMERLRIKDEVFFTGLMKNPYPLYQFFDVFMLASREDPCPLVVLENLYLEKSVVCFEGCGGAPELLRDDAGVVVSNLSISMAAQKIVELLRAPAEDRYRMGKIGRERIIESFDINKVAVQVRDILSKVL